MTLETLLFSLAAFFIGILVAGVYFHAKGWVAGYNQGIRDYHKADQWANKMMEGGFWDDDIDFGV